MSSTSPPDPSYQARLDIENGITTLADEGWTPDDIETFVESVIEQVEADQEAQDSGSSASS